jgi:hypothetical protein
VGIDPLHLGDRALELDGLVRIKLSRKCVMRDDRHRSRKKTRTDHRNH